MVVSLIYPETCGFAKVAAWEVLETTRREIKREPEEATSAFRSRLSVAQYQRFVNAFNARKENFAIPQKYFHAKLTDLQKKFSRWNPRKIEERTYYLNTFSTTTWANLSSSQKDEHSLMDCKSCAQRYSHVQSLFPVKCKQFPTTAVDSDILKDARHTASRIVTEAMAKNIKPDSTTLARALYNEIDPIFQYSVDVSLANALTTVRELRLSPKRSKAFEPLHDIGKHIENILVELPAHLTAKEASIVSDIVDVSLAKCWQSCLSNNISLPLQELRIPDENGNMVLSQVSTIEATLTVENTKVPEEDSVESTLHVSSSSTLSADVCDHLEKEENVVSFIEVRHDHDSHSSDDESEADQDMCQVVADKPHSYKSNENTAAGTPRDSYTCNSSISKAAMVVLGPTSDVIGFDKARQIHKKYPEDRYHYNAYMEKLAILHTKVSYAEGILKADIKAWEEKYYAENECQLPSKDKYDLSMKTKVKKLQCAKVLLRKFRS